MAVCSPPSELACRYSDTKLFQTYQHQHWLNALSDAALWKLGLFDLHDSPSCWIDLVGLKAERKNCFEGEFFKSKEFCVNCAIQGRHFISIINLGLCLGLWESAVHAPGDRRWNIHGEDRAALTGRYKIIHMKLESF